MELLNQFGFDYRLFFAQIINFLILAYIFKRFMYKPILKTLEKRKDLIANGLKDAEAAAKALEKAEVQKDEILAKASQEAERILAEAKNQAQATRESMMNETKAELEKMMIQTKEQIRMEHENFKKDARSMALELSRKILEGTVRGLFDKKEQDLLVKKGIQKIKNV